MTLIVCVQITADLERLRVYVLDHAVVSLNMLASPTSTRMVSSSDGQMGSVCGFKQ